MLHVTVTVLQGVHRTPDHTSVLYIWVTQMIRSAPKILAVLQRDKQSLCHWQRQYLMQPSGLY